MSTLTLTVVLIAAACVLVLVSLASAAASPAGGLPEAVAPQPAQTALSTRRESCSVSGDLVGDANPADVYKELCRSSR